MDLKTAERSNQKQSLLYVLAAFVYLLVIILVGHALPPFYPIFGTAVFSVIVFFSLRSYLLSILASKVKQGTRSADLPKVSLIIPSFNEEAVLQRTIPSCLALDYPEGRLELIYVYESACTDRTEEIIQSFARQDTRIKPVRRLTEKGGKAAVTNYGLQIATGDIIGFFDADHSLEPDILRHAVAQLQAPKVACVRGRCRAINRTQNTIARLVSIERDLVERHFTYGAYRMGGFANFGGGQAFFRGEVFEKLGLLNEDILTEDIDLSVKLHLAGYKIAVDPRIQSWEESPTTLKSLINQRRRWSRGWMQVLRMHWWNILKSRVLSPFMKADMLTSLGSSVAPFLLVGFIPLMFLSALGYETSYFSQPVSFWLWAFVTTTPIVTSLMCWALDGDEKDPPGYSDILYMPLMLPYIVFLFFIGWISVVDEFVLRRPFAYVKTERAGSGGTTSPGEQVRTPGHASRGEVAT